MRIYLTLFLSVVSIVAIEYDSGEYVPFYDVNNDLSTGVALWRFLEFAVPFSKTFSSVP